MKHSILEDFESFLVFERRLAQNSVQAYLSDIEIFLYFLRKNKVSLENLTSKTCEKFFSWQSKENHSRSTLNRRKAALVVFLKFWENKYQEKITISSCVVPNKQKILPTIITKQQMIQILKFFESLDFQDVPLKEQRNNLILTILYTLGLRVSELINLKRSSFSNDLSEVFILGKGEKKRTIPVPVALKTRLLKYFSLIQPMLLSFGKTREESLYCFFSKNKGHISPLTRQSIFLLVKKFAGKFGLSSKISPHKFRHSIATHLLNSGANLRLIQQFLGHETLQTVQIYTHMDLTFLRKEYDLYHPRA